MESNLERWRILLVRTTRRAVTVEAENAWDARKLAERKMNRDEFAPNEIDVVDPTLSVGGLSTTRRFMAPFDARCVALSREL
jgi:hypothetical protein